MIEAIAPSQNVFESIETYEAWFQAIKAQRYSPLSEEMISLCTEKMTKGYVRQCIETIFRRIWDIKRYHLNSFEEVRRSGGTRTGVNRFFNQGQQRNTLGDKWKSQIQEEGY